MTLVFYRQSRRRVRLQIHHNRNILRITSQKFRTVNQARAYYQEVLK